MCDSRRPENGVDSEPDFVAEAETPEYRAGYQYRPRRERDEAAEAAQSTPALVELPRANRSMKCICGEVYVGMHNTGTRNWNPDCPEHGVGTEYYDSPEQVERRAKQDAELRDLYRRAREARESVTEDGPCPMCDFEMGHHPECAEVTGYE